METGWVWEPPGPCVLGKSLPPAGGTAVCVARAQNPTGNREKSSGELQAPKTRSLNFPPKVTRSH